MFFFMESCYYSLNKILLLQKRILQYILKKDILCHTAPLFKTANILQIKNINKRFYKKLTKFTNPAPMEI